MAGGGLKSWPCLRRLWRLLLRVCFNEPGLEEAEATELVSPLSSGSLSSPLDLSRWRMASAIELRERLCLCLKDSDMSVQSTYTPRTPFTCDYFEGHRLRANIQRQLSQGIPRGLTAVMMYDEPWIESFLVPNSKLGKQRLTLQVYQTSLQTGLYPIVLSEVEDFGMKFGGFLGPLFGGQMMLISALA